MFLTFVRVGGTKIRWLQTVEAAYNTKNFACKFWFYLNLMFECSKFYDVIPGEIFSPSIMMLSLNYSVAKGGPSDLGSNFGFGKGSKMPLRY